MCGERCGVVSKFVAGTNIRVDFWSNKRKRVTLSLLGLLLIYLVQCTSIYSQGQRTIETRVRKARTLSKVRVPRTYLIYYSVTGIWS